MSTQANLPRPALPPAAVDRVFERMLAIFGVQRMTAAWGDVPPDERRAVWGGAIARAAWSPARNAFDLESVGAALDELADEPTPWPPSCGEFADIVARYVQRPARNLRALPVPRRTEAEIAAGAARVAALKAMLRLPARSSREPGSDDEPLPAVGSGAACTCWTGLVHAASRCPACVAFGRGVIERQERAS